MRIANNGAISTVVPGGSTLYPAYDCRAWVNFNGTGTVSIRASGNVSSITDNGTGDYTVNLSAALADANYSVLPGGNKVGTYGWTINGPYVSPTSNSYRFICYWSSGVADLDQLSVAFFR
jgi:hypothetical protein